MIRHFMIAFTKLLVLCLLLVRVLAAESNSDSQTLQLYTLCCIDGLATAEPAETTNVVPFDNLAQKLPEAFSALENQFSNPEFQAMLTSQLNNPNAVEMFQSLIHDPNAVNSISSLLEDPAIKSSLSAQFVEEYLSPTRTVLATPMHTPEATGDLLGSKVKNNFESGSSKHTNVGATSRPRALVIGCLLTLLFSALAPV
ncbi:hypothetical protein BX661DRAFT_170077 [Kickxella alabastrina]|uniref:uncharacterized protein n=1 Tax=Kickxella alabastrina TaxID=61397 RepID=UPI00221F0D42|nr:uncharacterized protein BX661DRAFT_170077 [Kickxella alabastrina]KAI7830879.1 hypothetical protein BX661DRAFT_170077 [Kickxella alabastrina]